MTSLITSREAAKRIGVSLKYFQNELRYTLGAKGFRLTPRGRWMWSEADIERWINSRRTV